MMDKVEGERLCEWQYRQALPGDVLIDDESNDGRTGLNSFGIESTDRFVLRYALGATDCETRNSSEQKSSKE
jgi:hypothetical protein